MAKQTRILAALWVLFLLVILSPTLRLGAGALQSRDIQFGGAALTVPKGWTFSDRSGKLTVSKPCYTIFCGSARAGFIVELTKLPDKVWETTARKNLQRLSPDADLRTVQKDPGTECLELDWISDDGRVMASCLNSNFHLTGTFRGDESLKPVFYQVMATAHRAN
jgi:hypothetical protein